MNPETLMNLRASSDHLFGQVQERITLLDSHLNDLANRIREAREKFAQLKQDRNKATRLVSQSSYPVDPSLDVRLPTIRNNVQPLKSELTSYAKGSRLIPPQDLDNLRTKMTRDGGPDNSRPIDHVRSVSSLIIYHTCESRLTSANSRHSLSRHKSMTSNSSVNELATGQHQGKSKGSVVAARSSSGGEPELDLGPVPDSILKYHHESLVEADTLDNVNSLLTLIDDDSNLFTDNLPDVLPTLTGVVDDVNLFSNPINKNTSSFTKAQPYADSSGTKFLSQFETLFKPIEDLPEPELFDHDAELYSSENYQ